MIRQWLGNIRARLVLWSMAVVLVVVGAAGAVTVVSVSWSLTRGLDSQLRDRLDHFEHSLRPSADGTITIQEEHDPATPQPDAGGPLWIEVWSLDGRLLARSASLAGRSLGPPPVPEDGEGRPEVRGAVLEGGESARVICGLEAVRGRPVLLRIGRSDEPVRHQVRHLAARLGLALPFAVLLAAAGGWFLAGRTLGPMAELTRRITALGAEQLSERLPVVNRDDELGRLTLVLNGLLDRLERAFAELRRFTADASHELRTPLAALRAVGEIALRTERSGPEYRESLGSMLEESARLAHLVDDLLLLSRSVAPGGTARELFDVAGIAREVVARLEVLSDERQQAISVDAPEEVFAEGDTEATDCAVANLVDNAVRHGLEGGCIRVVVRRNGSKAVLEVQDDGPGIAAEHLTSLFDRFYRIDPARSRATGGTGLGLAIARSQIERQGGSIEVESEVGRGSVFRIRLPRPSIVEDPT